MKEKPKPKAPVEDCLLYDEVISYIEEKYKIDTRDYSGMFKDGKHNPEKEYQDFWHLYCDDIAGNGSILYMSLNVDEDHNYPDWAKEILKLIKDEFGEYADEDTLSLWCEW
jgi:hypothetical protein